MPPLLYHGALCTGRAPQSFFACLTTLSVFSFSSFALLFSTHLGLRTRFLQMVVSVQAVPCFVEVSVQAFEVSVQPMMMSVHAVPCFVEVSVQEFEVSAQVSAHQSKMASVPCFVEVSVQELEVSAQVSAHQSKMALALRKVRGHDGSGIFPSY